MMKREELSRIASVKFKKAITDCSHAVSHRVLAFCVMAACLVFTLAVTAANLRLTYVTDSHGARQVVLTSAESDTARVMNLSGIEAEKGDNVYYTAFSGNLASLNIERAFAVSIQADGQEYSVKMAVGTVADALERAGIPLAADDYPSMSTPACTSATPAAPPPSSMARRASRPLPPVSAMWTASWRTAWWWM